jgi:putative DNA primase/helicase
MSLDDCRSRLDFVGLWGRFGLPHLDKVSRIGRGGREAKICSPFREDRNPSCSVWMTSDGVGFFKDHGTDEKAVDEVGLIQMVEGLDVKEAIKRYHELAGVPMGGAGGAGGGGNQKGKNYQKKKRVPVKRKPKKEEIVESAESAAEDQPGPDLQQKPRGRGRLVAEYDYQNECGELAHQTLRYEPKTFRQRRPMLEGETDSDPEGWIWTLKDAPVYPYRLPQILEAARKTPIYLVEGEKDVENMERAGLLATTLPMGAGKWRPEFAQWFRGRRVVVVADHDRPGKDGKRPGIEGARKVVSALLDAEARVGLLEMREVWPECQEGTDISDWLEWGWSCEMPIDDQRDHLLELGAAATVPSDLAYEGCLVDDDTSVAVFEDRLARRLVNVGGFMYCGSAFWEWRAREGVYRKLAGRLKLESKVREAMRVAKAEKKISHSKVRSIIGLAESEHHCEPEQLNQAPEGFLCVKNGMLDVMTGEMHRHLPDYRMTVQCPHEYDPGATCPDWLEWLEGRQPDEATRLQIQEMFGYCLVTDKNYHSFFFLYGDGGTGKSTCVKVLEELVGDANIKAMELEELDNPFTRAGLVGKSLYLCKELTASSFKHIGLIKALVSGDRISADVKYGNGFDFTPSGRLVMESNVIAATPDSSAGFSRRFIQISWDRPIEVIDYGLEKKLIGEMPGILNWALEGYRRLVARGRFEHTERSAEATEQLLLHRAQVPSFLGSGAVVDHGAEADEVLRIDDLFLAYQEWCELNDVVAFYKERPAFMREVMARRPTWRARKKRRLLEGLRMPVLQGLELKRGDDDDE